MRADGFLKAGFGRAVRRLRTEAAMSRAELAEACQGMTEGHLAKIEQGARMPSEKVLGQIASALGLEPRELLAIAEDMGSGDGPGEGHMEAASGEAAEGDKPGRGRRRSNLDMVSPRPSRPRGEEGERTPPWLPSLRHLLDPAENPAAHRTLARVEAYARQVAADDVSPEALAALDRIVPIVLDHWRGDPAVLERGVRLTIALMDPASALPPDQLSRALDLASVLVRAPAQVITRVAELPADREAYVWPSAVGLDEGGQVWVDPMATTHRPGVDEEDPQVSRLDDGRVLVDLTRLHDKTLGPRNPDRHRVRAVVVRQLPSAHIPIDKYESTVLEITWEPDTTIEVQWAPAGTADGDFPPSVSTIHIVTAHNPAPQVLPPEDNALRNERLLAAIKAAGMRWKPATGRSADPREGWEEASFALLEVDRGEAIELGRRFDQAAIFEWTPAHRALIRCDRADRPEDEAILVHGWSARWR